MSRMERMGRLRGRWASQGQADRRELECDVRKRAVEVGSRVAIQGVQAGTSGRLGIPRRTLSEWRNRSGRQALLPCPRGRPRRRSTRERRNLLLKVITALGPKTGVRPLRRMFPGMARSEIRDLLVRYRALEGRGRRVLLQRLHWRRAGAVWALDFARPPRPVDGIHRAILAVRDLACGEELLWRGVSGECTAEVLPLMERLFQERGRPLVLKSDNGSAFRSLAMEEFLKRRGVHQLLSPPRTPAYNGSREAGIGWMKSRTEAQAVLRGGDPQCWTGDDLLRAEEIAGAVYSRALESPPITENLRAGFAATVKADEARLALERGSLDATTRRKAISRALVAHGILEVRRRPIPLPIRLFQRAKIS